MKDKLFNWSINTTKDSILNKIKFGIELYVSNKFINKSNNMKSILKNNATLLVIIITLLISNIYSYNLGINKKNPELEILTTELESIYLDLGIKSDLLDNKDNKLISLKKELKSIKSSRVYKLAIIKKEADVDIPDRVTDDHLNLMFKHANLNNVPYNVFFRVIQKESRYKWWATSPVGAKGYMQVMPPTYKSIAKTINQPLKMTPESNIIAGSYYLGKKYNEMFNKIIHKKVYDKLDFNMKTKVNKLNETEFNLYKTECELLKSDTVYYNNHNKYIWELALSCYNAGSSRVKYKIPNIKETQNYVKFIMKQYEN